MGKGRGDDEKKEEGGEEGGEEKKKGGCCLCQKCQNAAPKGDPDAAMEGDEEKDNPATKPRSHTDLLALILYGFTMFVMTSIGGQAIATGNARALISPVDYEGNICGVDGPVLNKPYGYLLTKNLDIICLKECPKKTRFTTDKQAYDNMICMDESVDDGLKNTDEYSADWYGFQALFNEGEGPCNFEIASYAVGYYCVINPDAKFPNVPGLSEYANTTVTKLITGDPDGDSAKGMFLKLMQDLFVTRNHIFGFGFFIALCVAFFYSWLMTMGLITLLVWSCIIATEGLLMSLGAYMYYTATQVWALEDPVIHDEDEIKGMLYCGYFFMTLAFLFICFIICIISKIQLACKLVMVAGRAVRDIPITIFWPMLQVAALMIFLVPWMYYMCYTQAQGHFEGNKYGNTSATQVWVWDYTSPVEGVDSNQIQVFMMFCYFWTSEFIAAIGQLVLAMTFVLWYFAENPPAETTKMVTKKVKDPETGEEKEVTEEETVKARNCCHRLICGDPKAYRGNGLFFMALKKSVWYHVGSAAAGSLIIAIVKTIRYVIAKIQYHCEKNMVDPYKKVVMVVLTAIQCCLWCLEKCMKFINKHAYIIIALKGSSFCSAAFQSFFLILRNIRLIAALVLVQEFVCLIGRLVIIAATGALSYYYMAADSQDPDSPIASVNSFYGPVFMVMCLAYFIADMFMNVYAMAMDVMMQCFVADKEMFGKGKKGAFCQREGCPHLHELANFVEKKGKPKKTEEPKAADNKA